MGPHSTHLTSRMKQEEVFAMFFTPSKAREGKRLLNSLFNFRAE